MEMSLPVCCQSHKHKNQKKEMWAHLCARFPCLRAAIVIVVRQVRGVGDGIRGWGICSGRRRVVPSPFAASSVSTKKKTKKEWAYICSRRPCLCVAVVVVVRRVRVVNNGVCGKGKCSGGGRVLPSRFLPVSAPKKKAKKCGHTCAHSVYAPPLSSCAYYA